MQRYFAIAVNEDKVLLSKDDEHHILHVMRNKVGDEFEIVDQQKAYLARLDSANPFLVSIIHEIDNDSEINEDVTLLFALTKGEKTDLVIQKATELGVRKIALIESERTVVSFANKDIEKKTQRYEKIIKEASEQCHRLRLPIFLGVFNLKNLPKEVYSDLNYVAYEKDAGDTSLSFSQIEKGKSVTILVGPEGGFSSKEIEQLVQKGFIRTSLGKRILRAETAAIYALSVIGYLLER